MPELHTCRVDDVCGNTTIIRERTLAELIGMIGPRLPIVLDGVPGHLESREPFTAPITQDVVFVPNDESANVIAILRELEEIEVRGKHLRRMLARAYRKHLSEEQAAAEAAKAYAIGEN